MSTTTTTPIITREFRMAQTPGCPTGCAVSIAHVHYVCPYCGESWIFAPPLLYSQVFSVRCNESGELFLVDQGDDEVERKPMNGEARRVKAA